MKGNLPNIRNVDSVLCRYSIQFPSYLNIFARTVDISFEKNCMTQMVTVCQPKAGNISKKKYFKQKQSFQFRLPFTYSMQYGNNKFLQKFIT